MKKGYSLIGLILLLVFAVQAQDIDSTTVSKLKLNFSVPDIPAFKSLGSEPSDLLKPSTAKALALSMSQFYDNKTFIIPSAFAIEVSPSLLVKAHSTELVKYAKNAAWHSFRISLGSSTDTILSKDGRNLALGFRITPIDKSDPAGDTVFLKKIAERLAKFRELFRNYRAEFVTANLDAIKKSIPDSIFKILNISNELDLSEIFNQMQKADPNWAAKFDSYVKVQSAAKSKQDAEDFNQWIESEKIKRKKGSWNATKLDIAIAALSSSPDSIVKNIRFNKIQAWITYAHNVGKSGQLMIGLNGSGFKNLADRADSTKNNMYYSVSLPIRYLFGTNRIKGFIEFQEKYQTTINTSTNNLLFNLGSEINVADGFWINIYGGIQNNTVNGTSSFVTNMNLKFTIPENFKFF